MRYGAFMRMNKFVHVLVVFATVFITMQFSTLDTAEGGKYPRIRADAGDDFKVFENKEVKLDGSESRGGFKKFVDFEWELVRINGTKVQNNNEPFEINNDDKSRASFMAPEVASGEATYEFKLTVRDEIDREDDDIVMVHVMNQQLPVGPF
jgi:K319L-like, PKD domain